MTLPRQSAQADPASTAGYFNARTPPALAGITLAGFLAAAASAQAPTLVPAVLRNISPPAVLRGKQVAFTLSGTNISGANRAVFDDPAIAGSLVPGANSSQARLDTTVGEGARPGVHRVYLHTPLGTTGAVTFAVGALPEAAEKEPNNSPGDGDPVALPATFTGALGQVGDVDHFRFRAEAGQELVFRVTASQIRSRLNAVLTLLDSRGRELAEAQNEPGSEAVLGYRFGSAGTYSLRVRDWENAGGGDVFYRIDAGPLRFATGVFPLGIRKGTAEVTVRGFNLGEGEKVSVSSDHAGWNAVVPISATPAGPLVNSVRVAVGDEPEVIEAGAHQEPATAQPVTLPATINGRISGSAEADYYRFRARQGQEVLLEVNARRLGSPLDSYIEVLDSHGKPIERAALRCLAETALTLTDRTSESPGLRMLSWSEFNLNDYVYTRGEVIQLVALPRGPDDDARFRAVRGQRIGFFDTTPSTLALNSPMYKVQAHPPGTQFPPNGMPVFRLHYRNDDGGPLYGKDSRLTFTAPAAGEYLVRITDVRGEGSDRHAYRLTLREPNPDFRLSLSQEQPNIPAGSSIPLEVTADRLDGFTSAVRVRLEGLPAGFTATEAVIEAGETTATLLLTAGPDAKTGPAPLTLVGTARWYGDLIRTHALAGGSAMLTVLPKPDLAVTTTAARLRIVPGTEQHLEAAITRENGFAGRVPIELRNLPYGVRVLDVGLNGVLITEGETKRRFTIYCEPWVKPLERLVYTTVRTETDPPAEVAATPITLEVAAPP